ncbi:MAG: peptidase M23, partial [Micrococcales bacterium]
MVPSVLAAGFMAATAPSASAAPQAPQPQSQTQGDQRFGPVVTEPARHAVQSSVQDVFAAREQSRLASNRTTASTAQLGADVVHADAAPAWVGPMTGGYRLTSGFGPRWGRMHNGIDLATPVGGAVASVSSGVVTFAGTQQGYGNIIEIQHVDGTSAHYAHLSKIDTQVGDLVVAGQHIGRSGNTGASTGPHLHLEIHIDGTPVDPRAYLLEQGVDLA